MQGNDLSNQVVPRLVVVWEHLLGLLPSKTDEAKVSTYLRLKRWKRAVGVYQINEPLAHRIWDVSFRLNFSVDVITWLGPQFCDALRERLDDEDLPIHHVTYSTPNVYARKLAYMPYVAAIYTPDEKHQFLFGSKGRVISPMSPDLVGRF